MEWLLQIQTNLIKEYKISQQEEKKWFLLKELLLDANIELDLFSAQNNITSTIDLGIREDGTHSPNNILLFNRPKRRKLNQDEPSNII